MPVPITALYAGLVALLGMALAFGAGRVRGQTGISIMDGGNIQLAIAMRRHANWAEFAPITLILIGLLELNGIGTIALHALGAGLFVFRICHAVGLGENMSNPLRGIGAGGTSLVMVVAAIWSIVTFFV